MSWLVLSSLFFLLGLGLNYWVHSRRRLDIVVEPADPPADPPLISVCLPARNEERNIGLCIESILAQDYGNFELVVVDDRSTDSTLAILAGLGQLAHERGIPFRLIHGAELPPGWAGKPHALHQAAQAARGDWLCFVDADTFLAARTLSSVYSRAIETRADLFTIMTFQVMVTFWEKVVMPLVMSALAFGFSPRRVNDPALPDAIANGQFIFIKRSVYDAIGGHEAIRGLIVEDKAIADRVKQSGHRLIVADGTRLARTRMYTSLSEMWEGWTKNIYLGLSDRPVLLLLGAFGVTLLVIAAVLLPLWPVLGIYRYFRGGSWTALTVTAEALGLWAAILWTRARIARLMGISGWWALSTPLGAAVFAAMMLTSGWKVLSGRGVTWKGRRYSP